MKETDPGMSGWYSPTPNVTARDWVNAQLSVCDITEDAAQASELIDILGLDRDRRPELEEEEPA